MKIDSQIEDKGKRLDKFLVEKLSSINPCLSRSRIKFLIENNHITNIKENLPLNSCSYKIKGQEVIFITMPQIEESFIKAKDIPIEVIWEDENMMVINKQAGLVTHPGNGTKNDSLVNALLFHYQGKLSGINGVMRPGIVHRLDKDTSGLMVVAKNDLAHQKLASQIQDRTLKRNYLAICYGVLKPLSGVINKNIDRGKINRLKMTIVKEGGKKAITNYQVKKTYCSSLFSLVECKLDTGRTHQIRVHLSSIGHSIIGDQTYGRQRKSLKNLDPNLRNFVQNFPRQALHSYKISFLHPTSQKRVEFEVDFPNDIKILLQKLQMCTGKVSW